MGTAERMNNFDRLSAALEKFRSLYGNDGPARVMRAPARINILGEHVDYVEYLPTASLAFGSREHAMLICFRARHDDRVRGASMEADFEPFTLALGEFQFAWNSNWEDFVFSRLPPAPHWSNYVKGAVGLALWKHGARINRGFDFLIDSTIPPRAGASSSSALVVLAGAALRQVNQIDFTRAELARDSSQAEWFTGTRGGALDHTTICLAQMGRAVQIRHAERGSKLMPLPGDHHLWITFFTRAADKGREVMIEYNERAAVSRLLIPAIIDDLRGHVDEFNRAWAQALEKAQRDPVMAASEFENLLDELPLAVTLAEMARHYPHVIEQCQQVFPALTAARRDQPLKLRDRARHHIGEIRRVAQAAQTLDEVSDEDEAMRLIGAGLNESHQSLRDLYEVSTPEVERLIEVLSGDENVLGARLMGGGFGGNVLALVEARGAPMLIDRVQRAYYDPRGRDAGREGAVMISTPGDGWSEIEAV